jgi:hypothetical protein
MVAFGSVLGNLRLTCAIALALTVNARNAAAMAKRSA